MKQFLTLLVGLVATSVCYSAPTYTTYFNNTHTYTNATVVGTNFAGRGVFTNGVTAGASTFTGDVLQSTRTGIFDSSVQTLYSLPTRVVFDGDSLTSSNTAYASYFQSLYLPTFSSGVISNVAVSGQTIWDMLYSRYTNYVQPNKPDSGTNAILFAWGGINDIFYNTNSTDTVIATISNYWTAAKADGFTLVAFTITDRGNFPNVTNQNERSTINTFIRQSHLWDYLVDVDAKYPVSDVQWNVSAVDLTHFNTNAARSIADLAASSLFGPKNKSTPLADDMVPTYKDRMFFSNGTETQPAVTFNADKGMGMSRASSGLLGFSTAGTGRAVLSSSVFRLSSGIGIQWASGASWTTSGDSGIARNSAGVVRITDASTGVSALLHSRQVLPKTGAYTVVATNSNAVISNEGASALQINTLPAAVTGLTVTFVIQDADGLEVLAVGDDTIRIAGNVTGAAGNIQATTIGNTVTLCAINATEWVALSHEGTWTVSP